MLVHKRPRSPISSDIPTPKRNSRNTSLQTTIQRLFGVNAPDGDPSYASCLAAIRQHLRSPDYWTTATPDTIHERIGKGTYGDVFRGTQRDGGDVAIKTVNIRNEASLLNAIREFVIQDLVFNCYDRSATKDHWAPVHHPFPTLYNVVGHKLNHHHELRGSMFLFQPGAQTVLSRFQATVQVASVLCHLHTTTLMRFMHRDLHWNNIMRRRRSKHVNLVLWESNGEWTLTPPSNNRRVSRVFDCGSEAAVIDFGLAWLQLPDGQIIKADTPLYAEQCDFNSQHDLRLLLVSAYYQLCMDPTSYKAKNSQQMDVFSNFVADIVDKARQQSPSFAMLTSLSTIRRIRDDIQKNYLDGLTFEDWFSKRDQWDERVLPFLDDHKHIWKSIWGLSNSIPPLQHFLYGKAILMCDTPCFEPAAVLSSAAAGMVGAALNVSKPKYN